MPSTFVRQATPIAAEPGAELHEAGNPPWVLIRSLYTTGPLKFDDDKKVYGWTERFVAFNTRDFDLALEWAETESEEFADTYGFRVYPLWEAHQPFVELGHKAEIFSILRESPLNRKQFLRTILKFH